MHEIFLSYQDVIETCGEVGVKIVVVMGVDRIEENREIAVL
jgi:hypothetical protein